MLDHTRKKKGYQNAIKQISFLAKKHNMAPEDAALRVVRDNAPTIRRFLKSKGIHPHSDPKTMAAQAALVHEYSIWDIMKRKNIPDYEAAENFVLSQQQDFEDRGLAENFSGGILGSIFTAAKNALPGINKKRVEQGKKPILAGEKGQKFLDKINGLIPIAEQVFPDKKKSTSEPKTGVGIFIKNVQDEIEKQKIKEYVNKYLPLAIIAVVAIYMVGKNS